MALILHLETATKVCSVSLSENGKEIALKEYKGDGFTHGENLTLFIDEVLTQANKSMSDLSAISVCSGPGSYTGLRIGAATAKAICYANNIPLIAIDALLCLAAIGEDKYPSQNICPVIDARRMEVYNQVFGPGLRPLKEISADVITEDSYVEFEPFVYFGDGAEKLQEIWKDRNCIADLSIESSATGQVKIAFEKYKSQEFEDVAYWEPFYLKDFVLGKKKGS